MNKTINLAEAVSAALASGTVEFAYRKKTGELRIAKGTTKLDLIPTENHPAGSGAPKTGVKPYWDLNVGGWRAFNPDQVVWVDEVGHDNLTHDEHGAIMTHLMNR